MGMNGQEQDKLLELADACRAALAWVENMRITPGDKRDQLRIKLRKALGLL